MANKKHISCDEVVLLALKNSPKTRGVKIKIAPSFAKTTLQKNARIQSDKNRILEFINSFVGVEIALFVGEFKIEFKGEFFEFKAEFVGEICSCEFVLAKNSAFVEFKAEFIEFKCEIWFFEFSLFENSAFLAEFRFIEFELKIAEFKWEFSKFKAEFIEFSGLESLWQSFRV